MRLSRQSAARWGAVAVLLGLFAASGAAAASKKDKAPKPADDPIRAVLDTKKTPKEKIDYLNDLIDDGKSSKDIYFHLGNAKYEAGDAQGAAAAFEKAVAIDSTFFKAEMNLAAMYDEQQMFPKAIEAYEAASRLEPKNADVWSSLGDTYHTQKDYAKAQDLYKKALQLDPNNQHALYSMAVAFADAGIFREAVKYWKRVVAIDPKSEHGKNASENIDLVSKYLIP
jgi:tetratricopeptide (TPR) repeat protein